MPMKKNLAMLVLTLCLGAMTFSAVGAAWAQPEQHALNHAPSLSASMIGPPPPLVGPPLVGQPFEPAAQTPTATDTPEHRAPQRTETLTLGQMTQRDNIRLLGIRNQQDLEFTLRRDQLALDATLELAFTPSPALISKLSHLLVYLNDEMMGVVPVQENAPGMLQKTAIKLSTDYLSTYNRIRLEFVGHYADICEDLAHSSLWLDISRQTRVIVQEETLPLANDLAFFPEPFIDTNDMQTQHVPFVFASQPDTEMLEAAATLASYFGSKARWRTVNYPVYFDTLPERNAIILATNDHRPAFLGDYPEVEQPVIDMISAPDDPYKKLLIITGKDTNDVKKAVQALTLGGQILRGQSVQVDTVEPLAPRRPYDAPYWVTTDRPVLFSQLIDFPRQLETEGLSPGPIRLNLNLPPDLFVWRSNGIPLDLIYRYTAPLKRDESRLTLSLNDRFVASYPLLPYDDRSMLTRMHLNVIGNDPVTDSNTLTVPALRIGAQNQIALDFSFATTIGNAEAGTCRTQLPPDVRAAIDGNSSIDFTGYAHYLEMPNLRAFANSGFPFSKMADLSETLVVMPEKSSSDEIAVLLTTMALIGSQTGYPVYQLSVGTDWTQAATKPVDVLWIGATPEGFNQRPDANLLLDYTRATLTQPLRQRTGEGGIRHTQYDPDSDTRGTVRVGMTSAAPIGAIVGMQSPWWTGRSMVGLLGTSADDLKLLRDALTDPGKRSFMQGSVITIRTSGVSGELVGPTYFVGELKWWEWIWFHLSDKPLLLAALAALMVLIMALLLWLMLRLVARRRLNHDA